MENMKILHIPNMLFVFIIITAILFGCNNNSNQSNYSYDDQEAVEKFAIGYYVATEAIVYSVEKTYYNTKTGRYVVYLKNDEENSFRTITLGVANGEVFSHDVDDGSGEWLLVPPAEVIETPGHTVYEYY